MFDLLFVLLFAISAVVSAGLADVKYREDFSLMSAMPTIVVYVTICLLSIVGPLAVFSGKLSRAKHWGLVKYGILGDELFGAFGRKWLDKSDEEQQQLLGNVDPSSLADYGYAYEVVTQMRIIPFSRRYALALVAMSLAPFAPLLLMEQSVADILRSVLGVLG